MWPPTSLGSIPCAAGEGWMELRIYLNGKGKYRNKPSSEGKVLQAQHNLALLISSCSNQVISKEFHSFLLFRDHVEPRSSSDSGGESTAPFPCLEGRRWVLHVPWEMAAFSKPGKLEWVSLKLWARNNSLHLSWEEMSWLWCQQSWGQCFSYSPGAPVFIHLSFMGNSVNPLPGHE